MQPRRRAFLIGSVLTVVVVGLSGAAVSARVAAPPDPLMTEKPLQFHSRGPGLCVGIPAERPTTRVTYWESFEKNCRFRSSSVMRPRVVAVSRSLDTGTTIDFQIGLIGGGIENLRVAVGPRRIVAVQTGDSQPVARAVAPPADPFESRSRLVDMPRPCRSRTRLVDTIHRVVGERHHSPEFLTSCVRSGRGRGRLTRPM